MCYSVKYLKDKLHKYAKHHDIDDAQIPQLFDQHYAGAFSHPDLAVLPDSDPKTFHTFNWGLIPFWVKDVKTATKLSNQTLNARSETMFEKPSFRNSAMKKRCLIVVDGFYEYFHLDDQKIPYYIFKKNEEPMLMAGLWEKWELPQEKIKRYTVSIVTTAANKTLSKIHNNPTALKRSGPRMPVIIPEDLSSDWLKHEEEPNIEKEKIMDLCHPYPDDQIDYYTVPHSLGKSGVGNSPEAWQKQKYNLIGLP